MIYFLYFYFENFKFYIMMNDFEKFAISKGVNSNTLDNYKKKMEKNMNGVISPTILEERQMNVATMDVFSRLMGDRIIYLGTDIDSDVANIINAQLLYLNSVDSETDVKIFINSGGGSVIDGASIYDTMNWIEPDVATYVVGLAASMASVLCSSGAKGKRFAMPHSWIMLHQVSTSNHYQTCADLSIAVEFTKRLQDMTFGMLAENCGKTMEDIKRDADRNNWFSAQEAVDYGLIDEIIKKKK